MRNASPLICFVLLIHISVLGYGQNEGDQQRRTLALQLANPVADLIRIPLQNNYDFNVGPNNGFRYVLNLMPVIPINLNEKWNLISRTLTPVIFQGDVYTDGEGEAGLGDIVQSIFLTPKESTSGGFAWGIGPVLFLPTATNNLLGARKWAAGPAAVLLTRKDRVTFGASINHMWSYAGKGGDISASSVQPFITYVSSLGGSITLSAENSQNWPDDNFRGLISVNFAKIFKLRNQLIQLSGEPKVYYGNNAADPDWGFRLVMIVLYPK